MIERVVQYFTDGAIPSVYSSCMDTVRRAYPAQYELRRFRSGGNHHPSVLKDVFLINDATHEPRTLFVDADVVLRGPLSFEFPEEAYHSFWRDGLPDTSVVYTGDRCEMYGAIQSRLVASGMKPFRYGFARALIEPDEVFPIPPAQYTHLMLSYSSQRRARRR